MSLAEVAGLHGWAVPSRGCYSAYYVDAGRLIMFERPFPSANFDRFLGHLLDLKAWSGRCFVRFTAPAEVAQELCEVTRSLTQEPC